jgi:glutaminase
MPKYFSKDLPHLSKENLPHMPSDLQKILDTIQCEVAPLLDQGKVASYIPELASVEQKQFGMAVYCLDGQRFCTGDARTRFSLQSITKLFALALAFSVEKDAIWSRVDKEPSGSPFNSLWQLEYEKGIPRNPFINAGALVITDIISSHFEQAEEAILHFIRMLGDRPDVSFDEAVAQSEFATSHRNHAIAYLMKDFGNLHNEVASVIRSYCRQCSITMNCMELAKAGSFLANHGNIPWNGMEFLGKSSAKRLNALMLTCGTYDAAGEFAYRVGLPAKSGVGGGMLAIIPDQMSIAVWSPGLDENGNSFAGTYALERLTTLLGHSIF